MAESQLPQAAQRPSPIVIHTPQGPGPITQLLYFNGFAIALGSSDFTLVLHVDNAPALTLKCSYTTAKTFAARLQEAVKQFELITDYKLLTSDEIAKAMRDKAEQPK